MWTASVYTAHVTMFPRGSVCVYLVHVVKTSITITFPQTKAIMIYIIYLNAEVLTQILIK